MDFKLTEENKMLQEMARKFTEREVAPEAERIDREDIFPKEIMLKMGGLGWLGISIPEKYGGSGAGILACALVIEQIARVSAGVASCYAVQANLVIDNLNRNGNEEQKSEYLPPLCLGEKIGALGVTEPSAGSDAMSMQLKANKYPEGYVLNGTKIFISNGSVADTLLVYARTAPERDSKGISAFIVEKSYPGFSVGRKIEKLGHKGSPFGELVFENCLVPHKNLVGMENEGAQIVRSGLERERVVWAAEALGIAQGAFEIALRYSKERQQFGQMISRFQMIREKLADMAVVIEAGRLLVYKAASLIDEGWMITTEASIAKLYVCEMAEQVAAKSLHILGGYGYTKEFPLERYYRDAKAMPIGAGTSEMQRLIISHCLLK